MDCHVLDHLEDLDVFLFPLEPYQGAVCECQYADGVVGQMPAAKAEASDLHYGLVLCYWGFVIYEIPGFLRGCHADADHNHQLFQGTIDLVSVDCYDNLWLVLPSSWSLFHT
jgi:hypothetical protein